MFYVSNSTLTGHDKDISQCETYCTAEKKMYKLFIIYYSWLQILVKLSCGKYVMEITEVTNVGMVWYGNLLLTRRTMNLRRHQIEL